MLIEEAKWINDALQSIALAPGSKVLNVGSSTRHFRSVVQPYIEELIFTPLRERGMNVSHLDIKEDEGVDICGDLLDPVFLNELSDKQFDSIICSNLLEHVIERDQLCEALVKLMKPQAKLLVTVPFRYPYHKDPIDTLYRPTIEELAQSFRGTKLIDAMYVESSMSMMRNMYSNWKFGVISLARLVSFTSREWGKYIKYVPYIPSKYSATCILLEK